MSLLQRAWELVRVSSVSHNEAALATFVEEKLREQDHLEVTRVGDNVVARTSTGATTRVVVAGHLDTVPGDAEQARIEDDVLYGVGACDMKGSLAVMLALATEQKSRAVDVTWIFYAREEIARSESGLLEIFEANPSLVQGDVAIVGEPTGGVIEAGCQGTLRIEVTMHGVRAHSARPYMGRNAIHRLAQVIDAVASYVPCHVTIDGIEFVEQMQVVGVNGGVAPNVVPDSATCTINHRVAPGRSLEEIMRDVRALLGPALEDRDTVAVLDWAPSAVPNLTNVHVASLITLTSRPARAKFGWTDVATFQSWGIPATNFGAGDPMLAHRSDECLTAAEIDEYYRVLEQWLANLR